MRKRRFPRRSVSNRARPLPAMCEPIEPRLLLACDLSITDGTLMIASDGSSHTVFVAESLPGRASVICDGEAHTFEGVHAVIIDAGGGDDVITFQGRSDGGIATLAIDAGGGDDMVKVNFASGEGEAQPPRKLRAQVDAGAGADRVDVRYDEQRDGQGLDIVLSVDPGGVGPARGALPEVGDEVLVGLSQGAAGNRLYVGNLSWHSLDATESRLPAVQSSATLSADTTLDKPLFAFTVIGTDGRDEVSSSGLLLPAVQAQATASYQLDLGGGDNAAEIRFGDGAQGSRPPTGAHNVNATYRAGDGNNSVLIGMLVPAVQKVRDASAEIDVRVGGGTDQVAIDVDGFDSVTERVATGDGNDVAHVNYDGPYVLTGVSHAARDVEASVDLGPGDDAFTLKSQGADRATVRLIARDGHDRIHITAHHRDPLAKSPPPSDLGAVAVIALLGAGDDTLELFSYAYRSILSDIDTGPFGDGVDFVTGSHTAYGAVQPARKVIRRIDRGADLALWITVGFFDVAQDSHPSSTRQIVRLLAR